MGASHDRHLGHVLYTVGVAFLSTFVPGRFIPHAASNNPPSKSRFIYQLLTVPSLSSLSSKRVYDSVQLMTFSRREKLEMDGWMG